MNYKRARLWGVEEAFEQPPIVRTQSAARPKLKSALGSSSKVEIIQFLTPRAKRLSQLHR